MNRTLYSCLFYLALPLVALRLWLRARKAPAYAKRVGERFSYGLPVMRPGGIWVHAVEKTLGGAGQVVRQIAVLDARFVGK